jgi:hypothetical protein
VVDNRNGLVLQCRLGDLSSLRLAIGMEILANDSVLFMDEVSLPNTLPSLITLLCTVAFVDSLPVD